MAYYPIYLNITNKRCIVVGGGRVAERKVKGLLESGAKVAVVSRKLTEALGRLKAEGRITHLDSKYEPALLEGAFLVIGAANRLEINKRISEEAKARGILVNIVDDLERCDFILPALVRQGDLSIAVSTGGKSPALAKKLRKELEGLFGPEYAVLLDILGQVRKKVISPGSLSRENGKMFTSLVDSDILQCIKEGNRERVTNRLRELTGLDMEIEGDEAAKDGVE